MHRESWTEADLLRWRDDVAFLAELLLEEVAGVGLIDVAFLKFSDLELRRLERIEGAAETAGREWAIRPEILLGVAWVESRWDPEARNPESGALGLMQVMPSNARRLGLGDAWRQPLANLRAGARILREHGYGERPHVETFRRYMGADRDVEDPGGADDPVRYRDEVLTVATRLTLLGR